ncbi:hypothetical protein LZ578_07675 [Jeotgalibaca sp. MA1X17-3]|uniref:helix-turn-helix domain-containing protein n=1 Tax=Jeotgalibaca sp. MA1X17-3 TaxID=2908211 RepID=UPI001F32C778|nr:helix-turn-helix domain-containing protein [Jeotgalibaca sp. MA1X17-3]UJF14891.1 hypothetical protein LZ578_07675 [Jeotgalibaca sp. MA1X17-3]
MELWMIVIILLAIAIILLFISFFSKNKDSAMTAEITDFTLQMTKDLRSLKKRVVELEEASGITVPQEEVTGPKKINELTKQQTIRLYEQGNTFDEIAEKLEIPETTVQLIVDNHLENLQ